MSSLASSVLTVVLLMLLFTAGIKCLPVQRGEEEPSGFNLSITVFPLMGHISLGDHEHVLKLKVCHADVMILYFHFNTNSIKNNQNHNLYAYLGSSGWIYYN